MIPLLETLVHKLPLILCFPSICLAFFGIYVIQVKSTPGMKNYKKILIAIALVTLNFDIGLSVVIGPKPLPGAVGSENNGFVALLWTSGGRLQVWYLLLGFTAQFEICVIGFSYRERTVLSSHLPSWHKVYESIQLLTYIVVAVGLTAMYFNASADEEEARQFMSKTGRPYCQECSIFVITNVYTLIPCGVLGLFTILLLNMFIGISIYRIKRYLAVEKQHLSKSTVKMQKMLLTALIWQYLIPFVLVAIPAILMTTAMFAIPLITNNFEPQPLEEDMTAICLLMPTFFSIGHVFCTIYFTAPYKKYVIGFFTGKSSVTTPMNTAPSNVFTTRAASSTHILIN